MAISPGPSWIYTISTTLGHGRRAGMLGVLGNSTGILCHALASAAGLTAVLQYSSSAFNVLKLLGVAYLVYLGIRAFQGGAILQTSSTTAHKSQWQIFRGGALVNILNPKMSLLMVALLPQFIDTHSANPEFQIIVMGCMHALIAGIVHTHIVVFSRIVSKRLNSSGLLPVVIRRATGALFIGFGIRLALTERF